MVTKDEGNLENAEDEEDIPVLDHSDNYVVTKILKNSELKEGIKELRKLKKKLQEELQKSNPNWLWNTLTLGLANAGDSEEKKPEQKEV